MRGKGRETPLGLLLKNTLERQPAFTPNPIGDWREIVGEQIARYSQPKSLKDKILVVIVHDSVWKHHMDLNKEALLAKINHGRCEPLVEKVVVRVGELTESEPILNENFTRLAKVKPTRSKMSKKEKLPVRKLTPDEQSLLKSLPDKDLRTIGARLLKRLPESEE